MRKIMSGVMKLVIGGVVAVALFGIWKMVATPTDGVVSTASALDITDKDWVKGTSNAPVTLIEYTDFQCPACGAYYPILQQLSEEMGDRLRVVIRHYPLVQIHKNALPAARAAEAAGRQGKFWEMYDLLFINQAEWSNADNPMMSIFPSYAGRAGMDIERFRTDMADTTLDDKITQDRGTGNEMKITGTPSFFLNGEKLKNPTSIEEFKSAIERILP